MHGNAKFHPAIVAPAVKAKVMPSDIGLRNPRLQSQPCGTEVLLGEV
jgi:hypothetical protein